MRLRRTVPKIPAKSPVPPRLPFYKSRPHRTPSESTLLQQLIPLHFNFPRISTYKKPGRGYLLPAPKFCNSLLLPRRLSSLVTRHSPLSTVPVTPLPATLTGHPQPTENPATLSSLPATLTSHVKPNPFVCHSYKKHRGWGYPSQTQVSSWPSAPQRSSFSLDFFATSLLNYLISSVLRASSSVLPCPPHPGATHA